MLPPTSRSRRWSSSRPSPLVPPAPPTRLSNVVPILEDNAAEFLARLTNPTGYPGQGFVEADDVFSGNAAIKIFADAAVRASHSRGGLQDH